MRGDASKYPKGWILGGSHVNSEQNLINIYNLQSTRIIIVVWKNSSYNQAYFLDIYADSVGQINKPAFFCVFNS
jgi:hypothetical protein